MRQGIIKGIKRIFTKEYENHGDVGLDFPSCITSNLENLNGK